MCGCDRSYFGLDLDKPLQNVMQLLTQTWRESPQWLSRSRRRDCFGSCAVNWKTRVGVRTDGATTTWEAKRKIQGQATHSLITEDSQRSPACLLVLVSVEGASENHEHDQRAVIQSVFAFSAHCEKEWALRTTLLFPQSRMTAQEVLPRTTEMRMRL